MSTRAQVSELVARWQEGRRQGKPLTPEEVCNAHPELLREVQEQVNVLAEMEQFLGVDNRAGAGDVPSTVDGDDSVISERTANAVVRSVETASGPTISGYIILGELGRGGMGVVYQALQTKLNRVVALKMILDGAYAGERELARFRSEAEAVARLQHPNIVQIHEVGEQDGKPFFSLEFVDGGSLAQKIAGKPQPVREAATLVETLARAMQAAHDKGIVHRDLKPGNVLLTADGTPKIADFGLAKRLDVDVRHTRSGAVLGTPSYMAPEQASGKGDVGPAADVYALGSILYELLTGRPPFQAETTWDTLLQVLSHEPVPPTRLQPKLARDLETICLKCLEKEASRRYATADALADDLRRFLAHEPISARPVGRLERLGKWTRRHPTIAALTATSLLIAVLGVAGVSWQRQDAEYHREQSEIAKKAAATNEIKERKATEKATQLAVRLDEEVEETQANTYFTQMKRAHEAWLSNKVSDAEDLLTRAIPGPNETDRRSWEWHYLKRLCRTELVTLQGQHEFLHSLQFTPDGKQTIGCTGEGVIHTWDALTGKELSTWALDGHARGVNSVAFSRGGQHIASAGGNREMVGEGDSTEYPPGEVKIWDRKAHKLLLTIPHPGPVFAVAISPDGKHLASAAVHWKKPSTMLLFDMKTGKEIQRYACKGSAYSIAFSPNGLNVAAGCEDGGVRVWTALTGKEIFTGTHPGKVHSIAFRFDNQQLASADLEKTVRVWDVKTGKEILVLPQARRYVTFSQDGKRLASEGANGTLTVWDAMTGEQFANIRGSHQCACFRPDGNRLASAPEKGPVKIWSVLPPEARILRGHDHAINSLAFSPDGRQMATGTANLGDATKVWTLVGKSKTPRIPTGGLKHEGLAFTADGQRLVSWMWGLEGNDRFFSRIKIWNPATGKEVPPARDFEYFVRSEMLSPMGTMLALSQNGLEMIDLSTGRQQFIIPEKTESELRFSRDGQRFARVRKDGAIVVCDAKTGHEICVLPDAGSPFEGSMRSRHDTLSQVMAFHRDGQQLAAKSPGGWIKIWDLTTGKERGAIKSGTYGFAFTADGKRLVTVARDVQLWDIKTGHEVLNLRGHRGDIPTVGFSPDGNLLVTGGADTTVRVWNGTPLKTPPQADNKTP